MTKVCPKCDFELHAASFKFCSQCGTKMKEKPDRKCPKCKKTVSDYSKYCPYCGNNLTKS